MKDREQAMFRLSLARRFASIIFVSPGFLHERRGTLHLKARSARHDFPAFMKITSITLLLKTPPFETVFERRRLGLHLRVAVVMAVKPLARTASEAKHTRRASPAQ
jgi:hypothetical protein